MNFHDNFKNEQSQTYVEGCRTKLKDWKNEKLTDSPVPNYNILSRVVLKQPLSIGLELETKGQKPGLTNRYLQARQQDLGIRYGSCCCWLSKVQAWLPSKSEQVNRWPVWAEPLWCLGISRGELQLAMSWNFQGTLLAVVPVAHRKPYPYPTPNKCIQGKGRGFRYGRGIAITSHICKKKSRELNFPNGEDTCQTIMSSIGCNGHLPM